PVLSTLGAVSTNTWYEFDVTGAVAGDGLLTLGINTTSSDGVRYASRENTGFAPQLVVTLTPGDTIPPGTNITGGPSGLVATSSASFAFSSDEQNITFACRLDAGPFAACASPVTYSSLADGVHTFQAQATDAAGNTDAGAPVVAWSVDTAPPETTITSGPDGASTSSSA